MLMLLLIQMLRKLLKVLFGTAAVVVVGVDVGVAEVADVAATHVSAVADVVVVAYVTDDAEVTAVVDAIDAAVVVVLASVVFRCCGSCCRSFS